MAKGTENKKYYWLKLKEDFFRDKRIKKLRRIAGGDTFTIIYLKLQLLSLKNEGVILYEGVEPTFAEEVALEIDEDEDNVAVTINFLIQSGLLEELADDRFLLVDTCKSIGFEGTSAERVRRHREAKKVAELEAKEHQALQCNTEVTASNDGVTKCNTEIELKLHQEQELKLHQQLQSEQQNPEIDDVANYNAFDHYRSITGKTLSGTQAPVMIRWIARFPRDVIKEGLNRMQEGTPDNPFGYLKKIMNDWEQKGLFTLQAVYAEDEKFKLNHQNSKGANQYAKRNDSTSGQTDGFSFDDLSL